MEQLVCIILLNYNGLNDTVDCIDSIQKVDYSNIKIIVVDNNSNDRNILANRLKNYKNVITLISEKNNGFSAGNNIGIRYAKELGAEYVILLNNDTIVEKNFINNLVNVAKEKVDAGIVTGKICFFSKPEYIWYAGGSFDQKSGMSCHHRYKDKNNKNEDIQSISFATGCLMLITSEAINRVGLLDESYFMYCEDLAYSLEILKSGLKIYYVPDAVIYHKVSASTGNNSDFTNYYMLRNSLYIIKLYVNTKNKPFAYLKILLDTIKRVLKKDLNFQITFKAISDRIHNIKGKANI